MADITGMSLHTWLHFWFLLWHKKKLDVWDSSLTNVSPNPQAHEGNTKWLPAKIEGKKVTDSLKIATRNNFQVDDINGIKKFELQNIVKPINM